MMKIFLILRVVFCKHLRSNTLYIVSKMFCWVKFKNKAMTASVYKQTHQSFFCQDNVGTVVECLRISKCELYF